MMDRSPEPKAKHLVNHFSFTHLVIPLILLSIITAYILFVSSDSNVNALFERCFPSASSNNHAPPLSRIPMVGPPACCLVSFFQAALSSRRSSVIMSEILAYVGTLLTVTTMESARISNRPNWMIANPTTAWLISNLAGGAVIWQLAIVPVFLYHERQRFLTQTKLKEGSAEQQTPQSPSSASATGATQLISPPPRKSSLEDHCHGPLHRHICSTELHAIPISVAIGYLIPCLPFLLRPSALSVFIWLFFPAYVSVIRQIVRRWVPLPQFGHSERSSGATLQPESSNSALVWIYALPLACSLVAHLALVHDLLLVKDDRSPTTRAALSFIQTDFTAIGLTVLYWIFVEVGWRIALLSLLIGCVMGPGAGLCVSWMLRERELEKTTVVHNSGTARNGVGANKDK